MRHPDELERGLMLNLRTLKWYFSNKLDIIISGIGLIIGICIPLLYLISKTVQLLTFGVALFLASLIYLLIVNRKQKIFAVSIAKSTKILLELLFFLTIFLSFLILLINTGRPLIYFLLISFSAALLAFSIISSSSYREFVLQILKIFLISFSLKCSIFCFYGGSGIDYWTHLKMNQMLAITGSIDPLQGKETFFPAMHIEVAISQIMTALPIKDATNVAVLIPLIISSICVFLISRDLFNEKIGLLAMLLVSITDYQIYWAIAPQTTSFGICLFYFFIYCIFKIARSIKNEKWVLIILLFGVILIISHAVSSFIALITIFGLLLGIVIYKCISKEKVPVFLPIILLIYGIMLIQQWLITMFSDKSSFFDAMIHNLDYYVSGYAGFLNRPESVSGYADKLPPLLERVADGMGMTILIFLAILGCLYWLSVNHRNKLNFSIIIGTLILLGITLIFPFFGIRNILPTRWFAFIYLFLTIMAAFAIVELSKFGDDQKFRILFVTCIIFLITFFMITSTVSNQDSPLWLKNSTLSSSYTVQELKGAETISHYSDMVFSDSRYGASLLYTYNGFQYQPLISQDLSNRIGNIFVWRTFMENRPIRILTPLEGYYKSVESNVILDPEFQNELGKMQKVYENNDVIGYYIIKGT